MASLYRDINQFTPKSRSFNEDARAVYQSVFNIITTRRGERLFRPTFGISLEDELFELNDGVTHSRVKAAINSGISEWEPRVNLILSDTTVHINEDNHSIEIGVVFTIKGLEGQTFQIIETITR